MNNSIKFLFAGDFAPCSRFEKVVLDKEREVFGDLQDDIANADVSFVNLETPLSTVGTPIAKTGSNIRSHPGCIKAVSEAGFDVVGLANNHIMDFGVEGLEQTLTACRGAGLETCGAGKNIKEAQKILCLERKGLKIAFIAVAEHEFSIASDDKPGAGYLDVIDNTLQIEQARQDADLVFVTLHGGNEYFPYPRPGLRKICRFFINRGADAVICHHAHVPGAFEIYKDKPIVYSLGNLIFDHPKPPPNWEVGYALQLEYDIGELSLKAYKIIPYTQSVSQNGIRKKTGTQKTKFLSLLDEYNNILKDTEKYARKWSDFCQKEKNIILLQQYSPVFVKGFRKISKLINAEKYLILSDTSRLVKLNLIRCESHLELLSSILADDS